MRHEPQSVFEELRDPATVLATSEEGVTPSQMLTHDAWWARELVRGQEARRRRKQESLERKLRTAEGCQKVGKWACFATGVAWNVGIVTTIIQATQTSGSSGPGLLLMIPWILLPIWALVHLVGALRRFLVLHAARRHGIELKVRHPIVRRWMVMDESTPPEAMPAETTPAVFVAPLPGSMNAPSAGAQLDASLARDRQQRQQRVRTMQRKLDAACRFEQWGRRDCLWAAYLSIFFWASLLTSPGTQLPTGVGQFLMFVSGIGGTVGLALGAIAVVGARLRQRWLVKQARAQALEVARVNDSPHRSS